MGFSLGGSKQKETGYKQENTVQSYTPDAGFMALLNPALQQAQGTINQGYQGVTPGQIAGFQDPYTQSVIDTTVSGINRQGAMVRDMTDAKAAAAGAFGGSGWGRLRAENERAIGDQVASTTAGLNSQAYQTALAAAMGESQNKASFDLNSLGAYGSLLGLLGSWGTSTGQATGTSKGTSSGLNWGLTGKF